MLEELPSIGQLYGSWGYELINQIEPSVPINEIPENNIPYGSWMFFDQLVVFDQIKRVLLQLFMQIQLLQMIPRLKICI